MFQITRRADYAIRIMLDALVSGARRLAQQPPLSEIAYVFPEGAPLTGCD